MSRNQTATLGSALAAHLAEGARLASSSLSAAARELPVIIGVTPSGETNGPLENKLAEAREILVESGRVFQRSGELVMAIGEGEAGLLVGLANRTEVAKSAATLLANLFVCQQGDSQFPPPQRFVATLLSSWPTRDALPEIEVYSRTPVFDSSFCLLGPGYHAAAKTLVHGPEIEPIMWTLAPGNTLIERLPPHLSGLLRDFCFASEVDMANTLGLFLTGVLAPLLVDGGKPLALIDANQPNLGKTLLVSALGIVIDDAEPPLLRYTSNEEELRKELCATLRECLGRTILFDNARVAAGAQLSSTTLEAIALAPKVKFRILGQSANMTRQNDLVFAITMNSTRANEDLISRGLPIRLHYEGVPEGRNFGDRDLIAYARRYRIEILQELFGMVVTWNLAGRVLGREHHRCKKWAAMVGGILRANGISGLLTNMDDARSDFNAAAEELAALVEWFSSHAPQALAYPPVLGAGAPTATEGVSCQDLVPAFLATKVAEERLANAKGLRGQATAIGNYLATQLDRGVRIEHQGRVVTAMWRWRHARANQKRYFVEIVATPDVTGGQGTDAPDAGLRLAASPPPTTPPAVWNAVEARAPEAASETSPSVTRTGNEEIW